MTERRDRLPWVVFGASGMVALLTVIAVKLNPPSPPPVMRPGSVALPRMRGPAGDASTGDVMRSMGIGSLTWYLSILSAPLFVWLSRRLPFDRRRWASSLAVHLVVILSLVVVTGLLQYQLTYAGYPGVPPVRDFLRVTVLTGSLPFVTVAAAAHALEARLRARDREVDAARVRSQLAEARLDALNARLQPHFLFNTLQAISTLVSRDPAGAEKMLAHLADLLREVLHRGDQREVSLAEELRVLDAYIAISRVRFGDRLSIDIDAPADAQSALVPFFILQPLVENALHHGVGSRSGPASVAIVARRVGDRLVMTVSDDGPGAESPGIQRGIGLSNTTARLTELYGDRHSLTLGPRPDGGFQVTIELPFREA